MLRLWFLKLDDKRLALRHSPVAELKDAIIRGPADALIPLFGVLGLIFAGEKVTGPTAVVGLQTQDELRCYRETHRHVFRFGGERLRVLVEALDL